MPTGSDQTRLIVIRGNSGAGKSTVAAAIRGAYGRGIAIVGQDNLRRMVLRERDVPGGANIGLIDTVARYSLNVGYHVIVEGLLYADHYGPMLRALRDDHAGRSCFFYLDVPFEETVRRHSTRPQAAEFSPDDMAGWYRPGDLLGDVPEEVVGHGSALEATVRRVLAAAGLATRSRGR
ncbi:energy-coupling factor transporter ATP-binding protein EcfA2 [Kitasatospora sp. MAP12-15]|uniref:kinase n=1 Tax=unclassified Kitasatospora TaxID=2633591 RepID=UPI002475D0E6|nr:kinase [Kitasatospora sp. MAP12-44]MDH6111381.1 energy-coupling factor transporter ATP-binding protein EcfA2 [Kitasatospora sp. MAP12-44]